MVSNYKIQGVFYFRRKKPNIKSKISFDELDLNAWLLLLSIHMKSRIHVNTIKSSGYRLLKPDIKIECESEMGD